MTRAQVMAPVLAAALASCVSPESIRTIPEGQLYFPTGMIYAPGETEEAGFLFVASSNFDRRYTTGRLTGIDLSSLACGAAPAGACVPAFPAPAAPPVDVPGLGTIDEKGLASLAGELDGIKLPLGGPFRILIPSRAEGSFLQVVDTTREQIACTGEGATEDCAEGAISLEANRLSSSGVPRAPAPFSVSIAPDGDAFVTSLQPADSPAASNTNLQSYAVRLNALNPAVANANFIFMGALPTNSVAVGGRYAYLSGQQSQSLRLIDRTTGQVAIPTLAWRPAESDFNLIDTRGLALSPDESSLYLVTRRPDALLVLRVGGPLTSAPALSLAEAELLPLGASQVRVLPKPGGLGNLALVTTIGTQSYDAVGSSQGSLLVWDDAAGAFVAELNGFGFQPYGLALQPIGNGARVYVGLFGEGRIAVVDLPDLNRPEDLRLVARLGTSHACVVNPSARGCTEASP